jgi:hypothetical protein
MRQFIYIPFSQSTYLRSALLLLLSFRLLLSFLVGHFPTGSTTSILYKFKLPVTRGDLHELETCYFLTSRTVSFIQKLYFRALRIRYL